MTSRPCKDCGKETTRNGNWLYCGECSSRRGNLAKSKQALAERMRQPLQAPAMTDAQNFLWDLDQFDRLLQTWCRENNLTYRTDINPREAIEAWRKRRTPTTTGAPA